MDDYQSRVRSEERKLRAKYHSLLSFLHSHAFANLDQIERDDLLSQADCMLSYLEVLNRRIARF